MPATAAWLWRGQARRTPVRDRPDRPSHLLSFSSSGSSIVGTTGHVVWQADYGSRRALCTRLQMPIQMLDPFLDLWRVEEARIHSDLFLALSHAEDYSLKRPERRKAYCEPCADDLRPDR